MRANDDDNEIVCIEMRRGDIRYLLDTPRPFYRNCEQVVRILDAVRRALANGHAEGRH